MVNLKRYQIDDLHVIGIEIDLPANPVYIISNTHGFFMRSDLQPQLFGGQPGLCLHHEGRQKL